MVHKNILYKTHKKQNVIPKNILYKSHKKQNVIPKNILYKKYQENRMAQSLLLFSYIYNFLNTLSHPYKYLLVLIIFRKFFKHQRLLDHSNFTSKRNYKNFSGTLVQHYFLKTISYNNNILYTLQNTWGQYQYTTPF